MSLINQQNNADSQFNNWHPRMPGYPVDDNVPFAMMHTPEDQIHWLYRHLMRGPQTSDVTNIDARLDAIEAALDALDKRLKALEDAAADALEQLKYLSTTGITYDVTTGKYRASMAAARHTWQATQPLGMSVEELAQYSVEEVAYANVLLIATLGHLIVDELESGVASSFEEAVAAILMRDAFIAQQGGQSWGTFVPNDYIRRCELEIIDTDNLAPKEIMGVNISRKATPTLRFPQYMRPGTTLDLAKLAILWNDHMVTTNHVEGGDCGDNA